VQRERGGDGCGEGGELHADRVTRMALFDALRGLEVQLESVATERLELTVSTGFRRVSTTVVLSGGGETGRGEDVTYQAEQHDDFPALEERGRLTIDEFSRRLAPYEFEDYRRWGFESAALDLALRQSGLSLGRALGRPYRPVRFVLSTRLEIEPWLDVYPGLEFKLDPVSEWVDDRIRAIAATGRVRVLDLKGQYHGTVVDQPPDARLYRMVLEAFPDAILEDPALTDGTQEALRGAEERLSWDAPIHSAADIAERAPRYVNIKPSRFGSVERLLDAIDYCEANGIVMYGGGQFELGVGREHIQALASLFYPDAPNDVAPAVYHEGIPRPGMPRSPLPPPERVGF
jgi:L-alanine-DL-glutamate epimerase-like enolase superfamily enzyme